ncbi:MAG: DUF3037 domain-containing protein [Flavipsychrobacter sp.]|nr:DUF3037 domain-containing protein [Flavipsychrobacter sp.]
MQSDLLFEYAVIRVVPRVEREEFLNVGIVLYCSGKKFLKVMFDLDEERFSCFSRQLDTAEVRKYLCAFEQICQGDVTASPISKLPVAERFRWLTATRSTVVQASKVHPGFCKDPNDMLVRLYSQLVLQ